MRYHFGPFRLDVAGRELLHETNPVAIEPMVFDCLAFLLMHRDRMVSRDELVAEVWGGRFVSEATISGRMKSARQAIGDDGRTQKYIRTVHGRGFRFVGSVSEQPAAIAAEAAEPSADLPESDPVGAASNGDTIGLDMRPPEQPSVAVLPFRAIGHDGIHRVIADGLAEDIVTGLGRTRSMFVSARGSSFQFTGGSVDVPGAATRLGVRYVLTGSAQFFGDRLHLLVQLTDAIRGVETWAESYDRAVGDVLTVQSEIASAVIVAVEAEITRDALQRAVASPSESMSAWTAYHRGCWHMYRFTGEDFDAAERCFAEAAQQDPAMARVQAGLSFIAWQRAFLEIGPDRQASVSRALEHAQHALDLDPRDPVSRMSVGRALLLDGADYGQSLDELNAAAALNPNSALAHYSLGYLRMLRVEPDEGDKSLGTARRLSPYDPMSFAMFGALAFNAAVTDRGEEALEYARRAAGQTNVHYHALAMIGFCAARAGRHDLAIGYLARLKARHPDYRVETFLRAFPVADDAVRARLTDELMTLGISR